MKQTAFFSSKGLARALLLQVHFQQKRMQNHSWGLVSCNFAASIDGFIYAALFTLSVAKLGHRRKGDEDLG